MTKRFPWKTMLFWSSTENRPFHTSTDSEVFIDTTDFPFDLKEELEIWHAARKAALKAAEAQDPLQGTSHSFAAILTFLGGKEAKAEVIDYIKHKPITWDKKEIDPHFFRLRLNTPQEVKRFFYKICDTFPEMCRELREHCPLLYNPKL